MTFLYRDNYVTIITTNNTIAMSLYSCEVTMGDLQSEEERDILLELKLPVLSASTSDVVITGQLVYFNVISSTMDNIGSNLTIERGGQLLIHSI